jgi:hypothetical protein
MGVLETGTKNSQVSFQFFKNRDKSEPTNMKNQIFDIYHFCKLLSMFQLSLTTLSYNRWSKCHRWHRNNCICLIRRDYNRVTTWFPGQSGFLIGQKCTWSLILKSKRDNKVYEKFETFSS